MALPPLPENNTARYFVDYEGPYGKHSAQFRANHGGDPASVIPTIQGLINAIKPAIFADTTFNGLRFADVGSNISNPLTWAPIQGTAVGTLAPEFYPRFFAFWGRGPDGRETKLTFYGGNIGVSADYRMTGGENSTVAAGVLYLNTQSVFQTISGSRPIWKQYANTGYNAYFQRKRRTTA